MSSTPRLLDLIKNSPLSQDLNERDCGFLEEVMCTRTLGKDEVLLREGETDYMLHFVVSGRLAVTKDAAGESVTLHIMGPGGLAGEMGFVDGAPHSASLIALEEVTVLCLEREAFEKLVPEHPNLTYHFMRAIVRLGHTTLKRMNMQFVEMNNYITKTHGRY
ncbi:MAG: cyclic nucleotide-binding domain-containing protein [Acidihalobacter sp.]|jgi:CRP/FNR family transcriptional regulator, cyclic AMP receptor protein|uniref:Crp/Fnr family transcriptional regulator n=1 Tax=Acidihalobacter sp. TaxID=1872108 RepID=UPI00307E5408